MYRHRVGLALILLGIGTYGDSLNYPAESFWLYSYYSLMFVIGWVLIISLNFNEKDDIKEFNIKSLVKLSFLFMLFVSCGYMWNVMRILYVLANGSMEWRNVTYLAVLTVIQTAVHHKFKE